MSRDKLIVSVFGDSGAGKTTLAEALGRELGEERACVVKGDYFLHDRHGRALHELTCDFDLLASVLERPAGTLCHYPDYDFVAFRRVAPEGPHTFRLRPIVIVDQMRPYPRADVIVCLDMPFREAVERVLRRDPPDWEWRAFLADHWSEVPSVRDAESVKQLPNRLMLDGRHPLAENVARAVTCIERAWNRRDDQCP